MGRGGVSAGTPRASVPITLSDYLGFAAGGLGGAGRGLQQPPGGGVLGVWPAGYRRAGNEHRDVPQVLGGQLGSVADGLGGPRRGLRRGVAAPRVSRGSRARLAEPRIRVAGQPELRQRSASSVTPAMAMATPRPASCWWSGTRQRHPSRWKPAPTSCRTTSHRRSSSPISSCTCSPSARHAPRAGTGPARARRHSPWPKRIPPPARTPLSRDAGTRRGSACLRRSAKRWSGLRKCGR